MIEKMLTGHVYFNSPYESSDSCGTCDGAKCEFCHPMFYVHGVTNGFKTYNEAIAKEKELASLVTFDGQDYADADYFIKDDILYATIYAYGGARYIDVPCNTDSSIYKDTYEEVKTRHMKWNECICKDKTEHTYQNSCDKYGCNDTSCFNEMKRGIRTERKFYL